ncbi:hypothetical protein DAI22_05g065001 [Oryza sativa Japonica Group]|nr:hypothetical protein DAI22_05g065001 [Oryza sativa Japonica Group]
MHPPIQRRLSLSSSSSLYLSLSRARARRRQSPSSDCLRIPVTKVLRSVRSSSCRPQECWIRWWWSSGAMYLAYLFVEEDSDKGYGFAAATIVDQVRR